MKRGGILKRMPPRFFDNPERSSKFVRKYRTMKKYIFSLLFMLCCLSLQAQTRNKQYEDYIKKYRRSGEMADYNSGAGRKSIKIAPSRYHIGREPQF